MGVKNGNAISRREFARRAAFVSAAASFSPTDFLKAEPVSAPAGQSTDAPKLSAESQTEVDARIHAVFAQYGHRLSKGQKSDLTRLAHQGQAMLDRLRAYPIDNGDGPGLYLKPLVEREKKPSPKPTTRKSSATPKQP